jgi:hypothetical protein
MRLLRSPLYQEKLSRIKLLGEFVILSPVSLARALQQQGTGESQLMSAGEFKGRRDYFHGPSKSFPDLAGKIKTVLLDALDKATDHPFGPMASVPRPLRVLIRNYVMNEAYRTTDLLRERERSSSRKQGK